MDLDPARQASGIDRNGMFRAPLSQARGRAYFVSLVHVHSQDEFDELSLVVAAPVLAAVDWHWALFSIRQPPSGTPPGNPSSRPSRIPDSTTLLLTHRNLESKDRNALPRPRWWRGPRRAPLRKRPGLPAGIGELYTS